MVKPQGFTIFFIRINMARITKKQKIGVLKRMRTHLIQVDEVGSMQAIDLYIKRIEAAS